MTLPPGQRAIAGFPRFGTHFAAPAPAAPANPALELTGAVTRTFAVPLTDLAKLPRRELTADFHCVAGWSATSLRWEGVSFRTFYRQIMEPLIRPHETITHVVFAGLDGYRAVVMIDDALSENVLIAEHLDGRPLDADHGAPARLVSPDQYGFVSVKHLCRIELHAAPPAGRYHPSRLTQLGLQLVKPHPRARVWREERHRYLPAAVVRPLYRLLIGPIKVMSSRGSRSGP